MKKFKTYGKHKSKKDLNSDDWDEIKEAKLDTNMCTCKKGCGDWGKGKENNRTMNNSNSQFEDLISTNEGLDLLTITNESILPDTTHLSDKKSLTNLEENGTFSQLSMSDHSTPISTTNEELKSAFETPLKHAGKDKTEQHRTPSSSDYNFACKRSVIFVSSGKKVFTRKTPYNYSNVTLQNNSVIIIEDDSICSVGGVSFKDALTVSTTYSEAEKKILDICEQEKILSLEDIVQQDIVQKIGEGSYGEVFLKNEGENCSAVKIVPVGDLETQIRLNDIIPEMAISKKLSNWRTSKCRDKELYANCCVGGFIELKRIHFCRGRFSKQLIALWEEWMEDETNDCQNDHPDIYEHDQLYVVFENKFGGVDLEKFKLTTMREAVSILKQLVSTLAWAECSLQFEHRDLHWGNILIGKTDQDKELYILIDGEQYEIQSHGLTVSIIDFTLGRLLSEECVVFTDLSKELDLFTGEGDEQFDVYRLMKQHNNNEWESFNPYTNVLWIHYITNKLISKLRKVVKLKKFASRILNYGSAFDLLKNDELMR